LEQEGEEKVNSYWTTFKKRDDNGFWNRKYLIALGGRGCRLVARQIAQWMCWHKRNGKL